MQAHEATPVYMSRELEAVQWAIGTATGDSHSLAVGARLPYVDMASAQMCRSICCLSTYVLQHQMLDSNVYELGLVQSHGGL